MAFINKIFGDPNARQLNKLESAVEQINSLEKEFEKLSDDQLRAKTQEFKDRLSKGETLDDLLHEAFATVREASKRAIGMRHYDVQLLGGMVLNRGEITEMRTGEGKTLVATLPIYLNALEGKGAHLITVNDYLARRDTTWMGKIYHALGMSISCLQQQTISYIYDPTKTSEPDDEASSKSAVDMEHLREITRKEAYAADITYGTNNEFGFDFLRDNMSQTLEGQTQRKLNYAIVDEVDSILIDEARTPLIISAPAQDSTDMYYTFAKIVPKLKEGADYNVDEKMRAATLTEEGIHKVETALGVENLYAEGGMQQVHHLEQALKAHTLFKRDKEYVVQENEVIIVDEFTGRLMYGRRYSDGLHQAIEAKENVKIQQESVTMATITFQNYFRMYKKLSGMTGTAKTEEEEFAKIYGLPVLVIPTNKPIDRTDHPDRIYKNEKGKYDAVVKEIKEKVEIGQPVLVGTVSIEKNEKFSALLTKAGVEYQMLNAKDHEKEAQVIAQAGRAGAVTVATNMAGRGVDIVLGGDPPDADLAEAVKRLGGLHVIGTERHESRRIDNQLRGRSGRQGDPGSSVFFISTDDDLMRIFGSDRMKSIMEKLGVPDDMPIENNIISKSIESAQKKVEGHNFDTRKHLVEYDDVINKHREVIYGMRQKILDTELGIDEEKDVKESEVEPEEEKEVAKPRSLSSEVLEKNKTLEKGAGVTEKESLAAIEGKTEVAEVIQNNPIKAQILDMVEQEVVDVINFHTTNENQEEWNMDEIYETIDTIFPVSLDVRFTMQEVEEKAGKDRQNLEGREALTEYLIERSEQAYGEWEQSLLDNETNKIGIKFIRQVEKAVLLRSIDTLWVEHLDAMDHLRTGIGLRGYGQRDPLVEYKKESFRMFDSLQLNIRKQLVYSIYKVGQPIQAQQSQNLNFAGATKTMDQGQGQFTGINATGPAVAGATGGDMGPRPSERLARKKEGVQNAPIKKEDKIGRNDPCPCGSGKKYKKCGLLETDEHKESMKK